MNAARVVLLTSNGLRHRFAAARLAAQLEMTGIVIEQKRPVLKAADPRPDVDLEVMRSHLQDRDRVEALLLGSNDFPEQVPCLEVDVGEANSIEVFDWVTDRRPDAVLLYGTSIIGQRLLAAFKDRVINLHLGLSPYYKGTATNFWPLVDRLPECVGATIHLAVPEVDAGPILTQVRPSLAREDGSHEIGTRALVAGVDALGVAVARYLGRQLVPKTQESGGKIFRRKDFCADAVRRIRENVRTGMVADYLDGLEERRGHYPIIAQ